MLVVRELDQTPRARDHPPYKFGDPSRGDLELGVNAAISRRAKELFSCLTDRFRAGAKARFGSRLAVIDSVKCRSLWHYDRIVDLLP